MTKPKGVTDTMEEGRSSHKAPIGLPVLIHTSSLTTQCRWLPSCLNRLLSSQPCAAFLRKGKEVPSSTPL